MDSTIGRWGEWPSTCMVKGEPWNAPPPPGRSLGLTSGGLTSGGPTSGCQPPTIAKAPPARSGGRHGLSPEGISARRNFLSGLYTASEMRIFTHVIFLTVLLRLYGYRRYSRTVTRYRLHTSSLSFPCTGPWQPPRPDPMRAATNKTMGANGGNAAASATARNDRIYSAGRACTAICRR